MHSDGVGLFPLDDLTASVSRLPDDRLSRDAQVLDRWRALAASYPRQVNVSIVAESKQGRPIWMATVANDVYAVLEQEGSGGHLTINGAHAPEFLGDASCEVGSWLAPRTGALAQNASFRRPYRVLLGGDVDGIAQNHQYGPPLTLRALAAGIHRPYGLGYCVDYGMPIIDGSHASLSVQVNGRRLPRTPSTRRGIPADLPEAEVVARLISEQGVESCLPQHLGFCDMFPFAHALSEGDPGFHASVSAVVGSGFSGVNPFDPDWPRKTCLAPGVFLATSDSEVPASLRHHNVGATIRDYVRNISYDQSRWLLSLRYVLPDLPMFRAGRVRGAAPELRQQALDRGTRICDELALPFLERLDHLSLDPSDRSQEAIGLWLESFNDAGTPTVGNFIPSHDGDRLASDVEEFTLGDRRVLNTGVRLAEAGRVAALCGDDDLARDIRVAVRAKFDEVGQRRFIRRVSVRTLVTTTAYMEMLALGGSLVASPFRFPEGIHRAFDVIREQERMSAQGMGESVVAPYAPVML